MSLFTDVDVVTIDDLLRFESSLINVSSAHSIDVETKIELAVDEIGDRLLLSLLQAGISPQSMGTAEVNLSNVVVSPSLYRWLCFNSLARVYSEAYNVQLNTRFQGKWTEYQQQAIQAANLVMAAGVGVVAHPLPKPALPTVSVSQGSLSSSAFFVQVSWIGNNNQEGAPSPIAGTVLNGASAVSVSPAESGTSTPANAVGWNLYASTLQEGLTLQNSMPIALGTSWQMPAAGLRSGRKPTAGQAPDLNVTFFKRLHRG